MAGLGVWVEAARPRTLAVGVAPVLAGTAAADRFVAWRAVAALVVALGIQVGVNYANDLFDARRGVDTPERVGPRRATAAGLVSPAAMARATAASFAVAALAGLALAAATSWWLLAVGATCFLAALGYSGGPRPYGSAGFGELSVFVFFGLVATAGSCFVQAETITPQAWAAAFPVGLAAVAVLVANNLRDAPTDAAAGKHTLAVRLGEPATRALFAGLVAGVVVGVAAVALASGSPWALLGLAGLAGLAPAAARVLSGARGRDLLGPLAATSAGTLLTGAGLAVGLWLG